VICSSRKSLAIIRLKTGSAATERGMSLDQSPDRPPGKSLAREHRQIFWVAVIGLGGSAFGLGSNLVVALDDGHGWWKVGLAAFSYLCLCFALWALLQRLARQRP
jgi:hypothetical protein